MNDLAKQLDAAVPLQAILGYLNFATGKPDVRFPRQLSDALAFLAQHDIDQPWRLLPELLRAKLKALQSAGSSAFREASQVEAVIELGLVRVPAAYREHHEDLLIHLRDEDLFQPFFLARACEAVLTQGGPWEGTTRIVTGALKLLNDFVGYRPIAILETRPRGEPYEHERVRPIPLFIRGAGVANGRYARLIDRTLAILNATPPSVQAEACFDPDMLDELALDPRAYDHGHPVNRRPNYVFGEWDPHHLDNQGRYRRFVVRPVTLDALLDRITNSPDLPADELLEEAAAVLAGTILMAAGMSGSDPATHDSTTTLSTLVPRIARYRDAFYTGLLEGMGGPHGSRLRQEADATRQPFGAVRQHLNQYLTQQRAFQLQERHLALLFAEMGYAEASRERGKRIPAASVRILSELHGRLSNGYLLVEQGRFRDVAGSLPELEHLLRRGIACGALADPWNILGFQGLFPLFTSREDSVRDTRLDELIQVVEGIFGLYARLLSDAAARGEEALVAEQTPAMQRLAAWWDRFATVEVADVRHVHGADSAASAEHVATALARWHARGTAAGDLGFWRDHLQGFQSAKAFALVVEALLRKKDHRAAMALLMNWLGQNQHVPLEDGEYSFHALVLHWMLGVTADPPSDADLVRKFFDYLEANADELWQVPSLVPSEDGQSDGGSAREEGLYGAAYQGVTFRDSADDSEEGSVADGSSLFDDFDLDSESERLGDHLRFLSTLAKLWGIAARVVPEPSGAERWQTALQGWNVTAADVQQKLLTLLDAIHACPMPGPLGSYESLVEFDRRRVVKEQLTYLAIGTCLDMTLAAGALRGALGQTTDPTAESSLAPDWEPMALELEHALVHGDPEKARGLVPGFLERFQEEPLLFTALADGGEPRQILRARKAQQIAQALATQLPQLGLFRETVFLLRAARDMERMHPPQGRSVTEFNHLFESSYRAILEATLRSATAWEASPGDEELVQLLERLTEPFLELWIEHSQTLRLAILETAQGDSEAWEDLVDFIKRFGGDLFHARFMTLANLRGILHRGMDSFLDYMRENPDPLHPVRLIDEIETGRLARGAAEERLRLIIQAVVENYEEYKDYNTTTTHSDYGENLYVLLDFLRLKASYERHSWEFRPLVLAHEALARHGRESAALGWEAAFAELTADLAVQHLEALSGLEREHRVRLRSIANRLQEKFVRPLALDRLCALIEPAVQEARAGGATPSFTRLQERLNSFAATPSGAGLDVPFWLRRLEAEVQRVRAGHSDLGVLARQQARFPGRMLPRLELEQQLGDWQRPSTPGLTD